MKKGTQAPETKEPLEYSASFLIEEYKMCLESYNRMRDDGTNRLNFFIALASALLGGAVLIASNSTQLTRLDIEILLLVILAFLIFIGVDIYNFTLSRQFALDKWLRGMNRIRRYFVDHDMSIEKYLVHSLDDEPTGHITHRESVGIRRINQIILAFMIGLAAGDLLSMFNIVIVISALVGFLVMLISAFIFERSAIHKINKYITRIQNDVHFPKES